MSLEALSAWREPLSADWRTRAKALGAALKAGEDDAAALAAELRRLGGQRMGDGERLQARRLAQAARKGPALPGFRPFRLLTVSNRTLSFLTADLEVAGLARAMLIEPVETGFDAVAALALNPSAAAPEGPFDAVLLLLDASFFPAPDGVMDEAGEAAQLAADSARLAALVTGLRAKAQAPVLVATIPAPLDEAQALSDPANPGSLSRRIGALNAEIARLASERACLAFDLATVAGRIGTAVFFDPARAHLAKLPFSLEASPIVADALAGQLAALCGKSARVLVLDLDNTLWGGVAADDGLEGITLGQGSAEGEAFLAFQRYALAMRARGVALAVCSKNLDEIAREPFRKHPDMVLKEEHIAVFLANFDDKATNLVRIAKTLDLDVASLVFVDDNPAERERVRAMLPFAYVPEVGEDPSGFVRALVLSGILDHGALTMDDANRAKAYQARAEALAARETIGDYETYLASLDMALTIAPFDAIGRARIAQLFQKSNQFNLTTKRHSEADIEAIERDPARIGWQIRLRDRFADHGMICCVILEKRPDRWVIDSWIMSCRVLERGVEQTLMRLILDEAATAGATRLEGTYIPTPRNALVQDFYPKFGFAAQGESEGGTRYARPATSADWPLVPLKVTRA